MRLQFTSANLERNGSVPESPASIKSFITPKNKNRCKKYLQFAGEVPNDAETEENLGIYPLDVQDVCQTFPQSGSLSSCRPRFISAGLSTSKNAKESKSERRDSFKVRYYELLVSRWKELYTSRFALFNLPYKVTCRILWADKQMYPCQIQNNVELFSGGLKVPLFCNYLTLIK